MKKKRNKMKEFTVCMVCREEVTGSKYVVVRHDGDNLYYHDPCMPPEIRARFDKPKMKEPGGPPPL